MRDGESFYDRAAEFGLWQVTEREVATQMTENYAEISVTIGRRDLAPNEIWLTRQQVKG